MPNKYDFLDHGVCEAGFDVIIGNARVRGTEGHGPLDQTLDKIANKSESTAIQLSLWTNRERGGANVLLWIPMTGRPNVLASRSTLFWSPL